MFSTKPRKSKTGMRIRVKHHDDSLSHEVREMFIGHHTIFSLIGLAVGGTLVAKTLWEWLAPVIGQGWTLIVGLIMFVVSGLFLHTFDDHAPNQEIEELEEEGLI